VSESPPETPLDSAFEIPSSPYALETVTHLNQDQLERLTGIFKDIGVDGWLERNPLSRLELSKEVLDDGVAVNGIYSFVNQTIRVATARDKREYGRTFEWQRVYSVSSTAQTPFEAIQRTLVHELGHHVHNLLRRLNEPQFVETQRVNFLQAGTVYGKRNPLEYFAECFALYVYFPDPLERKDPSGYVMLEKALHRVGLEVTRP
jgi:hypothetical protein